MFEYAKKIKSKIYSRNNLYNWSISLNVFSKLNSVEGFVFRLGQNYRITPF